MGSGPGPGLRFQVPSGRRDLLSGCGILPQFGILLLLILIPNRVPFATALQPARCVAVHENWTRSQLPGPFRQKGPTQWVRHFAAVWHSAALNLNPNPNLNPKPRPICNSVGSPLGVSPCMKIGPDQSFQVPSGRRDLEARTGLHLTRGTSAAGAVRVERGLGLGLRS